MQANLFDESSVDCTTLVLQHGRIDCSYGESGIGWNGTSGAHCHKCLVATAEACARFDADVRAGKYDAQGYTPAERRAKERRAHHRGSETGTPVGG